MKKETVVIMCSSSELGKYTRPVKGYRVTVQNHDFILVKNGSYYNVSDALTGVLVIPDAGKNQQTALSVLKQRVEAFYLVERLDQLFDDGSSCRNQAIECADKVASAYEYIRNHPKEF